MGRPWPRRKSPIRPIGPSPKIKLNRARTRSVTKKSSYVCVCAHGPGVPIYRGRGRLFFWKPTGDAVEIIRPTPCVPPSLSRDRGKFSLGFCTASDDVNSQLGTRVRRETDSEPRAIHEPQHWSLFSHPCCPWGSDRPPVRIQRATRITRWASYHIRRGSRSIVEFSGAEAGRPVVIQGQETGLNSCLMGKDQIPPRFPGAQSSHLILGPPTRTYSPRHPLLTQAWQLKPPNDVAIHTYSRLTARLAPGTTTRVNSRWWKCRKEPTRPP